MRMKEVCEQTGLTDRAVRLYIDSGLLYPEEESSYTGRKSIRFSAEDVEVLEAIATLRKADFSISDIRDMQMYPDRTHGILEAHKQKLAGDIQNKQRILQTLQEIDTDAVAYTEIADRIRKSASQNFIPKEDSGMRFKDFQQQLKNRIFSMIAFGFLTVGLVTLLPMMIRAAFADVEIASGGGYNYLYTFTGVRFRENIAFFIIALCMAAAAVLLILHVFFGHKGLLAAAGVLCIVSVAGLLFLPAEMRQLLYVWEFLGYRYSFMYSVLYSASYAFDYFIQSLKLICPISAAVLIGIGFVRQKDIVPEE